MVNTWGEGVKNCFKHYKITNFFDKNVILILLINSIRSRKKHKHITTKFLKYKEYLGQ